MLEIHLIALLLSPQGLHTDSPSSFCLQNEVPLPRLNTPSELFFLMCLFCFFFLGNISFILVLYWMSPLFLRILLGLTVSKHLSLISTKPSTYSASTLFHVFLNMWKSGFILLHMIYSCAYPTNAFPTGLCQAID